MSGAEKPSSRSDPPPGVLDAIEERTGGVSRVLLPDADSEHGSTPILGSTEAASRLRPRDRGNYRILGEIARGGMGTVLKGHDADLGRDVAVKVLDAELAKNPAVLQRFVEEAQIGGQLQHPGVVPVYELGLMSDERPYFAMKLVKGRTLAALFSERKRPDEDRRRFLAIFEAVCQTVGYAHSKGVVHRDLKPANVMVGAFGEVQVVDWGLAKVLGRGGVEDERRARQSELTVIETVRSGPGSAGSDSQVGSVMGTPAYMPPEQALGEVEKIDERADVFALGAILCELLTGRPPYRGSPEERTVVQASRARLDVARERIEEAEADAELKELCLECLAPSRAARPRNAGEVARRIHEHLAAQEERAREAQVAAAEARVEATEKGRRLRLTVALATAVVVALLAVGGALRWTEGQRRERVAGQRRSLEEASARVVDLQGEGRWEEASEVARSALALLEEAGSDANVRERAIELARGAEERAERARTLAASRERDTVLLAELEELQIRMAMDVLQVTEPRVGDDVLAAFRRWGVELGGDDLEAATRTLQDSRIGVEVALALDAWAFTRRAREGWDSPRAAALTYLAIDLDPDPDHTALREAMLTRNADLMLEFVTDRLEELPPSLIWAVAGTLFFSGAPRESYAVLQDAVELHPDAYLLNFSAAFTDYQEKRFRRSAERFRAAQALRPHSVTAHRWLGNALLGMGDHLAAANVLGRARRMEPENFFVRSLLAFALWRLGDREGALEEAAATEAFASLREGVLTEQLVIRYWAGAVDEEALARRVGASRGMLVGELFSIGAALADPLRPDRGDPALALELAQKIGNANPAGPLLEALVHERLGRTAEARRTADLAVQRLDLLEEDTPWILGFLRARIAQAEGRTDLARAEYDRWDAALGVLIGDREEEWSRSIVVLHRRLTEEALGIGR